MSNKPSRCLRRRCSARASSARWSSAAITKSPPSEEFGRRRRPSAAPASSLAKRCSARVCCRWSLGRFRGPPEQAAPRALLVF